jgi:hypothetical protein
MKVGDKVWLVREVGSRREAHIVDEYALMSNPPIYVWKVACPSLDSTGLIFRQDTKKCFNYGNNAYWIEPMDRELNLEEKATNFETYEHINKVMLYMEQMKLALAKRQFSHDRSKLEDPEVEMFTRLTHKLKGITYGSQEYKDCLAEMGPALEHHYSENAHHPEHHNLGVDSMTLIDVLEMLCDWYASCQRHADGNIYKSIDINTERFGLSDQLANILRNTVKLFNDDFTQTTQKGL